MVLPYSLDELAAACREVIKKNGLSAAYLRPVAYRGLGGFGLSADTPIDVAVATWPMGPYLGPEALEKGITACVSSWQRFAPNTIPAGAKAGGNYLSGQLIAREARRLGFGEGIAMASSGLLSEGAGENLFLVFDGVLHTTPASASILTGITRDTLKVLAREEGIEVVERDIPREYLYLCDELLMCGTAAEITPINSVDGKQIGNGTAGRVTRRLQELLLRPVRRQHPRQVGLAGAGLSRSPARCEAASRVRGASRAFVSCRRSPRCTSPMPSRTRSWRSRHWYRCAGASTPASHTGRTGAARSPGPGPHRCRRRLRRARRAGTAARHPPA